MNYDHKRIEKKWQRIWQEQKLYQAKEGGKRKKFYALIEFPYASGEGLHVGHIRSNTAMDIIARKRRAEGFNVLYPVGWDAFGLPTENYAIKTGIHPRVVTKKNTDTFRRQLKALGFSFDWSREINTSDPAYYKWTQWIFLKFFENGLAYKKKMAINWCPKDKIGLANEEVVDEKCERCGTPVEKREKEQWMLAITKYADRLDRDLDIVDFAERIKIQQRNWIGRSEGYEIEFAIKGSGEKIKIFTTRPETILGVTFLALALDHPLATRAREGLIAINPATKEEIPVVVAEYVLSDYGAGAVMGVPAHDERDAIFAQAHQFPIKNMPFASSALLGKICTKVVTYKLRDWVFSRQRYWGEPIPLIFCEKCGWVAVPKKNLPVKLPEVKNYQPTDTGESPLALIEKWVNVKCPQCKGPAKRETDTMPNWAGSSWYFLRYTDPKNKKVFADRRKLKYWLGVDWYNGGMEHTTLHLLYSRFWHKLLFDLGLVPTSEPYQKRTAHGLILGDGGVKMSKSVGNVVNPDSLIQQFGADTLRLYEMFIGPFDQAVAWNTNSIVGVRRFLERVWRLKLKTQSAKMQVSDSIQTLLHKTIKKVSEDIESMRFNTAVSSLMLLVNAFEKETMITRADFEVLLKLLAPFAPHIAEELWSELGHKKSVHTESWPVFARSLLNESDVTIVVQVNGKTRGQFQSARGTENEELEANARVHESIQKWTVGKEVRKVIVVPNRLVNIVVA